jgi:hypothetical protein
MTSILNPGNPPVAPGLPTPDATRLTRRQPSSAMPGMQAFGAQNNLIGQQITPTNSAFTQGMQNKAQGAGDAYNNFQFGQFQGLQPMNFGAERGQIAGANSAMQGLGYDFGKANQAYSGVQALGGFGSGTASANTGRFNSELDGALQGLQGPDRAKLASDTFAQIQERSQPGFEQALRGATQKAAAMGRRGAGMTTNELGDITTQRERELALAGRDLSIDAAGKTLSDRLGVADFQRGVANDRFGGEKFNASLADAGMARDQQGRQFGANIGLQLGDRYADQTRDTVGLGERKAGFARTSANDLAGLTRDTWNSQQSERDAARRDEYDQNNVRRTRFSDFLGATRDGWNQDRSTRNELRGERDYQYGLSRDAVDDEYRRMNFEESMRGNRYGRGQGYLNSGGDGAGLAGAYGAAGAQQGANAADSYAAFAQMMQSLGRGQRRDTPPGLPPGTMSYDVPRRG